MENWDEIKTAYQVARIGTVSGAAEILGVHHATVIRHIDALESRLGIKLFQRHARGYTPTEAGDDLFRVAQATDDQFSQLVGRIKGRGSDVSGELTVTSLVMLAPRIVPIIRDFQSEYPEIFVRYLTGDRLFRLEYGEAHVAIRAGSAPDQPDNVVQPFFRDMTGLFASKSYVERYGQPQSIDSFDDHRFVSHDSDSSRAPFYAWLRENVRKENIIFRSADPHTLQCAVLNGVGIGFLPHFEARTNPDLIEILKPLEDWVAPLWLVTHVDLHRTTKVQTFLSYLKERAKEWQAV